MTCTQPTDCASGQVCGNDGFCASESIAGTCTRISATDAGVDAKPPKPPDASTPPPDTSLLVKLTVRIDGRGDVEIPTIGKCEGGSGNELCVFDVQKDVPLTLHALSKMGWRFDRWEDACSGALTDACAIVPSADTFARARFEMIDDD